MISNTLECINVEEEKIPQLISECEENFHLSICRLADAICKKKYHEIVLLAGPSASGKTTMANKIIEELTKRGRQSYKISLDDFYMNRDETPLRKDGSHDYETVDALDLPLLSRTLTSLVKYGECELPIFDFMTGKRSDKTEKLIIDDDDIIIVEGLHALNPKISEKLPKENVFKVYISVSSKILNQGKSVMHRRDLRFIRRLVRDYKFRNSSVENTYSLWQYVIKSEDEYLYPFRDSADFRINSTHYYAPCVFKSIAIPLLKEINESSKYYESAQRIIKGLEQFNTVDIKNIPENSLLREFLGN